MAKSNCLAIGTPIVKKYMKEKVEKFQLSDNQVKTFTELYFKENNTDVLPTNDQFIAFVEANNLISIDSKPSQQQNNVKPSLKPEVNFEEDQTTGYIERTKKNASADATIDFGLNQKGESWTKKAVDGNNKKYIGINTNSLTVSEKMVNEIVDSLNSVNAKTLNIAGMGIYNMKQNTQKQVDDFTYDLLKAVLESPKLKTKIESIRTGGQTGFDEAGAKAGLKLGIPTKILAPKGWKFRDINGKDISNENLFKSRFGEVEAKPAAKPEIKPEEPKVIPVEDHILTESTQMEKITLLEQQQSLDILQSAFWKIMNVRAVSQGELLTKDFFEKNFESILDEGIVKMLDTFSKGNPELLALKNNYPHLKSILISSRLNQVGVSEEIDEDSTDRNNGVENKPSLMFDPIETAKDEVRYMFNSLFKNEALTDKVPAQYNYSEAMNLTMNLLGGSTSLKQQVDLLSSSDLPFKNQLLKQLGVGEDSKLENEGRYERIRTSFFEQFSKAKSEFHIVDLNTGVSYNALNASLKQDIKDKAKGIFGLSKFVEIRTDGQYKLKKAELIPLNNLEFINALGFKLTEKDFDADVTDAVNKIRLILGQLNYNVSWLDDPKLNQPNFQIKGYLSTVLDAALKKEKQTRKLQVRNAEGESQSSVHNHSFFTRKFNKLKTGVIKAKNKLEKIIAQGKVDYTIISGATTYDKKKSFNKLATVDLYVTAITNMFSPGEFVFSLPRTSDKSLEQGIVIKRGEQRTSTGEYISEYSYMSDYVFYRGEESKEKFLKELYDQYKDDISINAPLKFTKNYHSPKEYWNEILGNVLNKKTNNILTYEEFKSNYNKYVEQSAADLFSTLKDKIYREEITNEGKSYIKTVLKSRVLDRFTPNEKTFFKSSKEEQLKTIKNLVDAYVFNSMYYGYEITKTFYGTFTATKSASDFFKRTSAMIAETRSNDLSPEKVNYINETRHSSMSNFGSPDKLKVKIHKETKLPSSKEFQDIAEKAIGQIGTKTIYNDNNVDDGQAKIHFGIYRELCKFINNWSKDQERVYNKLMNNEPLIEEDKKVTFPPLKPVGFDLVDDNGNQIPVFLKCAAYPLIPQAVKGTKNESTIELMNKEGIGLIGPDSIIKNARPDTKPEYKGNASEADEKATFEMSMDGFGIQVDVNPKTGFDQLQGTQIRKLIEGNLVNNGQLDETQKKWLDKNHATIEALAKLETNALIDEVLTKNNAIDNKALKELLLKQLYERGATTNQIAGLIEIFDGETKFIDTLPNRTKLMNVINSLVTNNVVRLYTNGSTLVQISQAGWELKKLDSKKPTDAEIDAIETGISFVSPEAKRKYYRNDGLEFLTWNEKDKKIGAAEIILPEKFRPYVKINSKGEAIIDDEKVLINIGYRIPTQGLNSILHLKVVGYLPAYMEQVIIMPKEITSQGGSDFDVDKINLYIPNVVTYKGKSVYVDQNVVDKADDIYNSLIEENVNRQENAKTNDELKKITERLKKIPSRQEFKKELEKQKLQNDLLANSLEILENGELTLKQLLTPNSSDVLKDLADKLYGKEDKLNYGKLFEPKTLIEITAQMYGAKALVGVFAAQSVHHALGQQVGLHLNPTRPLYFKHNSIEINGNVYPSLSGIYKADGKTLISEMVGNQYSTASLDAAKDPFLFILGVNGTTANVVCLFERLGGDTEYLMQMLKQPIIKEYLNLMENNDSLSYKSNKLSLRKKKLIEKLTKGKPIEYTAKNQSDISNLRDKRNKAGTLDLSKPLTKEQELMIFDDFLHLNDMARLLADSIAVTKFDTSGPGKDLIEYSLIYSNYNNFLIESQNNILKNKATLNTYVDNQIKGYEYLVENTIMKPFKNNVEQSIDALYNNMSMLTSNSQVNALFNMFNDPSGDLVVKKLTSDDAEYLYEGILNYIVQNSRGLNQSKFVGPNSVAAQIVKIQTNPNHPLHNTYLFKSLFNVNVSLEANAPSIITVNNKFIDKNLQESIEKEFSELKESYPQLFNDLVTISFFQSGFTKSPASLEQFIPAKTRIDILQPILQQFSNNLTNSSDVYEKIAANIGMKLSNIQEVYVKKENGVIGSELSLEASNKLVKVKGWLNREEVTMLYIKDDLQDIDSDLTRYKPVPPKNFRTLFTNYTDANLVIPKETRLVVDDQQPEITEEEIDAPISTDIYTVRSLPERRIFNKTFVYNNGVITYFSAGNEYVATPEEANAYIAWVEKDMIKLSDNGKLYYVLPKNISKTQQLEILSSKLEPLPISEKQNLARKYADEIKKIALNLYNKYCK